MLLTILLFLAGVVGGALNAVAGGGSFIIFPAMLFAGISPIAANATTTVGVWPGSVASAFAYRKDLPQDRRLLGWMIFASLLGGGAGALWLLKTSDATFVKLIPFLIGFGALMLTFDARLQNFVLARFGARSQSLATGVVLQFFIAIYGGYFGGGMGILMLAAFTLIGMTNIHSMNGLKNLVSAALNGVAIILFLAAGQVRVGPGIATAIGCIAGGYFGAALARQIAPAKMKMTIVIFAWLMTAWFAYKAFAWR